MAALLDTHTFLWFVASRERIPAKTRNLIEETEDVFLSIASVWEIAIKLSVDKLRLDLPFDVYVPKQVEVNNFRFLPIELAHLAQVATLYFHHKDPFDRLLIAQAIVEQIPIVSVDTAFDTYPVTRIW